MIEAFLKNLKKNKGKWFANVVYEVADKQVNLNEKVRAIDIGIINLASAADNQGNSKIYSGKQVLADIGYVQ